MRIFWCRKGSISSSIGGQRARNRALSAVDGQDFAVLWPADSFETSFQMGSFCACLGGSSAAGLVEPGSDEIRLVYARILAHRTGLLGGIGDVPELVSLILDFSHGLLRPFYPHQRIDLLCRDGAWREAQICCGLVNGGELSDGLFPEECGLF